MSRPRIAINGFGRIGRTFLRAVIERLPSFDVVAVNDPNDASMLGYLLEFDTVHGQLGVTPVVEGGRLVVGDTDIALFNDRDPAMLPWADLGIDLVVESTGAFTMRDEAIRHIDAGAQRVLISAPATGADLTLCMGINDDAFDPDRHVVISNASCTTNCLAQLVAVLHEHFEILSGFMTTVHAYTNDQNLLDLPHRGHTRDPRRARAAGQNIVPSTTGAAGAIGLVIPELAGKLDGLAVRVPVADGSITDLVCHLAADTTVEEVNAAFRDGAGRPNMQGVLAYTERPLVSSDIVGNPHSCIFSACDTMARGDHVKVLGWYDNEWGYANRLLEAAELVTSGRRSTTSTVVPSPIAEVTSSRAPISSARSPIPTSP